jgi:hypothetical protein
MKRNSPPQADAPLAQKHSFGKARQVSILLTFSFLKSSSRGSRFVAQFGKCLSFELVLINQANKTP